MNTPSNSNKLGVSSCVYMYVIYMYAPDEGGGTMPLVIPPLICCFESAQILSTCVLLIGSTLGPVLCVQALC